MAKLIDFHADYISASEKINKALDYEYLCNRFFPTPIKYFNCFQKKITGHLLYKICL